MDETNNNEQTEHGINKFLTVGKGVKLVRFAGKDEVKLVARRVGTSGNPNTLFEIMVDKVAKVATVWRNDERLFEIRGVNCNNSRIERIAIGALHRFLKDTSPSKSKRDRAKKAREAESQYTFVGGVL